jgi:hypothetical protein
MPLPGVSIGNFTQHTQYPGLVGPIHQPETRSIFRSVRFALPRIRCWRSCCTGGAFVGNAARGSYRQEAPP